LTPKN